MVKHRFLNLSALALGACLAVTATQAQTFEALVQSCNMCHGPDGNSMNSSIPSIAGMTAEYFLHTMDAYKNDGRKSDMMKNFVHTLSDDQLRKLASHYQSKTFVPRDQQFDTELAAKGKILHDKYCEKCHEQAGLITENNYGFLAGQWTPYLKQTLNDYLAGKRRVNPMMIKKLKALKQTAGDEGIEQIMHYYASKK